MQIVELTDKASDASLRELPYYVLLYKVLKMRLHGNVPEGLGQPWKFGTLLLLLFLPLLLSLLLLFGLDSSN